MKRWLRIAAAVLSATCSLASAVDLFRDLEGSALSREFTPAERRYFTEALDRYQKYELSGDFKIRSIAAWLDNDHIVFSARKLPGWEATGDEHSRIISMNVTTGEYEDTGYRGRLICLNHLGDVMIRQGGDEIIVNSSKVKYEWFIGKWGEALTPVSHPDNSLIPPYLCRFSPYGDQIYTTPKEKISEGMRRTLPLLPGHGYLLETVEYTNETAAYPVFYVNPDGSSKYVTNKVPLDSEFYFLPWMNAYYERSALGSRPRFFYISGEFAAIPTPKLFWYWSVASPSVEAVSMPTKAGIIWDVRHRNGAWKKQGIYLDSPEGLLRIEEGSGVRAKISPNGCRIMDGIQRENPRKKSPQIYKWMVIDICMEKK